MASPLSLQHIKSLRLKYRKKSTSEDNYNAVWSAIEENLNDWQSRLVFSDLLEEQGFNSMAVVERRLAGYIKKGISLYTRLPPDKEEEVIDAWTGYIDPPINIYYKDDDDHNISFYGADESETWWLCCDKKIRMMWVYAP